jgi:N-acetylmuramoyl-L-alanine amidase
MKKILFVIGSALCFTITGFTQTSKGPIKTLIIDPGHGGLDPGAVGTFATEANVSLEVSLKLGDSLAKEFPDMKILYTRTTDVLPGNATNKDAGLKNRAKLANESKGDLFIAVHCNSAGSRPGGWYEKRVVNKIPITSTYKKGKKTYTKTTYKYEYENVFVENKAKGTETYLWAVNKNESKISHIHDYTGEIDSTSTLTLPDPSDPAEKARMLVYAQNYFRKSLNLASYIQDEFRNTGRIDRGVKQRNDKGIWVLQATAMPSILVEIGFISNLEEEKYIASEEGQREIVGNIVTAFKKYVEKLESKAKDKDKDKDKEEKKGF